MNVVLCCLRSSALDDNFLMHTMEIAAPKYAGDAKSWYVPMKVLLKGSSILRQPIIP